MAARDAFEFINELDPATTEAFIKRLEFRGQDATFITFREAYLDRLALPPDAVVLDLGCGTGVVTRALAARRRSAGSTVGHSVEHPAGRLVGVDQSPILIEAARRLAAEEGLGERIDFRIGDAHHLDFPDGSFDALIAHTLVSHTTDPLAVLQEAARVVRPGGWVAIFDGDYASWTFASADEALGKAMDEAIVAAIVGKPRIMRDLPRLLRQAGLERVETLAFVYADVGTGTFFPGAAETFAPLVARTGLQPPAEVDRWLLEQRLALENGTFFAACNYYAHLARR